MIAAAEAAALGALRVAESVATVGRCALLVLAACHGFLGVLGLIRRFVYG